MLILPLAQMTGMLGGNPQEDMFAKLESMREIITEVNTQFKDAVSRALCVRAIGGYAGRRSWVACEGLVGGGRHVCNTRQGPDCGTGIAIAGTVEGSDSRRMTTVTQSWTRADDISRVVQYGRSALGFHPVASQGIVHSVLDGFDGCSSSTQD
jgi:hypothetical protein